MIKPLIIVLCITCISLHASEEKKQERCTLRRSGVSLRGSLDQLGMPNKDVEKEITKVAHIKEDIAVLQALDRQVRKQRAYKEKEVARMIEHRKQTDTLMHLIRSLQNY